MRTNGIPSQDGSPATELTATQIENLEDLIKGAIGFSEERGDVVTLVPMKFFEPKLEEPSPEGVVDMIRSWTEDPTFRYLLQMGLATFLVLLTLFMVVRPALRFYMAGGRAGATQTASVSGELSPAEVERLRQGDIDDVQEIKSKLMPKKRSIPEDMLDTANTYDEKIALMKMITAEDPGRVANMVKRMLAA